MPHISYFINTYTFKGFVKSLLALPGHNARGVTSRSLSPVPWGDQYRIDGKYSLSQKAYDEDYDEYECYYIDEDYEEEIIEHLSPRGWVQL